MKSLGIAKSEPATLLCYGEGFDQETVAAVFVSHRPECPSNDESHSSESQAAAACKCDSRRRREALAALILNALEREGLTFSLLFGGKS